MLDGPLALNIAVLATVALVLPTTYVNCCIHTRVPNQLSNFPRKKDLDYKREQVQPCSLGLNRDECSYKQQFCAENIWDLADKIRKEHPDELQNVYAVFMTGTKGPLHIWKQEPGYGKCGYIIWEYHVVLLHSKDKNSWVFDFASTLSFPEELKRYCSKSFVKANLLKSYYPLFRVIKAENYLKMFDPENDTRYLEKMSEAPLYNYVNMPLGQPYSEQFGEVLDLSQFLDKFS